MKKIIIASLMVLIITGCDWGGYSADPVNTVKSELEGFVVEETLEENDDNNTPPNIITYFVLEIGEAVELFPGDHFNIRSDDPQVEFVYTKNDSRIFGTLIKGAVTIERPSIKDFEKIKWEDYEASNMELLEYYCRESYDVISSNDTLKLVADFDSEGVNCITLQEGKCKIYKKKDN